MDQIHEIAENNFKRAENESYKVILFPIRTNDNEHKSAELLYNVKVTHKASKFVLSFAVRKLADGTLIAGSTSKMNGYRAVIDEYKGGKSFEKLSIPKDAYVEIMNLIQNA